MKINEELHLYISHLGNSGKFSVLHSMNELEVASSPGPFHVHTTLVLKFKLEMGLDPGDEANKLEALSYLPTCLKQKAGQNR